MKDVVDKCSTKGCVIDIGTVIDNDNVPVSCAFCHPRRSRVFMTNRKSLSRRRILCR